MRFERDPGDLPAGGRDRTRFYITSLRHEPRGKDMGCEERCGLNEPRGVTPELVEVASYRFCGAVG